MVGRMSGLELTTATCLCSPLMCLCCPPGLQTRARGEISFNIDGGHMYQFDRTLYNWAVTYPAETGACGEHAWSLHICQQ